ncbi:DoxX family protein [Tepidamorphus sp. 3E244]|uniref:DoxX family protein n=1 Tax=Tepidamorphus sp. 3E244 TaxID=3385498 RepID=UPI0038FCEF86
MFHALTAPISPVARLMHSLGAAGPWVLAVVALFLRVMAATPFWKSGLTKWQGDTVMEKLFSFELSPSVSYLFSSEYKIRQFGGEISLPFPDLLGLLASLGEVWLAVLVFLGLLTRLGALGLFGMTIVIQLVYPEGFFWLHAQWFVLLILVLAIGPGRFSLDWLLSRMAGQPEVRTA